MIFKKHCCKPTQSGGDKKELELVKIPHDGYTSGILEVGVKKS